MRRFLIIAIVAFVGFYGCGTGSGNVPVPAPILNGRFELESVDNFAGGCQEVLVFKEKLTGRRWIVTRHASYNGGSKYVFYRLEEYRQVSWRLYRSIQRCGDPSLYGN